MLVKIGLYYLKKRNNSIRVGFIAVYFVIFTVAPLHGSMGDNDCQWVTTDGITLLYDSLRRFVLDAISQKLQKSDARVYISIYVVPRNIY